MKLSFAILTLLMATASFAETRSIRLPQQATLKCVRGGCSGERCLTEAQKRDMMTSCDWKEEYRCMKLMDCGHDGKGHCVLTDNEASRACYKSLPTAAGPAVDQ